MKAPLGEHENKKEDDTVLMKDDKELISMFVSRSEKAIQHTAEKYSAYCHSIANRILKNHEDSEECVNDTFLNAWNSIPPNIPHNFSGFLGKITRNIALNIYEKKHTAKRGKGQMEVALAELAECVDMKSDIERENERQQIRDVINTFIRGQNEQRKNIFIQRYWYLMSIKEIAAEHGMNTNQVKSVLYQMRVLLKKELEKEDLF